MCVRRSVVTRLLRVYHLAMRTLFNPQRPMGQYRLIGRTRKSINRKQNEAQSARAESTRKGVN